MAPLRDPAPPGNAHCHWSPAWPISSPGAFPRPCAPAFKQSAGVGRPCRSAGRALAVGWCSVLSLSAAQGDSGRRLVPGAVNQRGGRGPGVMRKSAGPGVMRKSAGPASVVAVEAGGPGASGGFRCSGHALPRPRPWKAPREVR